MRKLLNTLYVSTQGAYLFKDGETLAVRIEHEVRLRLPLHTLQGGHLLWECGSFALPDGGLCGARHHAFLPD